MTTDARQCTRPTSSSSRSAPTTTWTRRPGSPRRVTSSTPSPAPSGWRSCCRRSPHGHAIIGVCGAPFKCPPAPSEAALLLHDYLSVRGVRDDCEISIVIPFGTPVPPSPDTSAALVAAFAERGIEFVPGRRVASLDAGHSVARARRRQRAAVRPLPRRAEAPRAGRRHRERHDRGRLRPGRARRRSRRGSRACTRSGTSPPSACRRRASSPRGRRVSSPRR